MERVPAVSTVAYWLDAAYRATDEDIKKLQWQWRMDSFMHLERMKKKFMTLALTDDLEIQRWVRSKDGEMQPTIDENAIAEQLKATEVCVKIMARQARLFGLDLETAHKEGEGFDDLQGMQVWIIQQVNQMVGAPNGSPIIESNESGITLELTSGL